MRSLLCVFLAASSAAASGAGRSGFEAVAVSHDAKLVAVGGQNRVVYLLDESFEVKSRVHVGSRVGAMCFSKDGKRLAIEDENDTLRLLDLETMKLGKAVEKVTGMVAYEDAVAVRDTDVFDGGIIRVLSLADLKATHTIELTFRPAAWAFADGGKQMLALSLGRETKERIPLRYPPELTGLARQEFRLKNDGLDAILETRDLKGGKVLGQQRLWYTSDSDSTLLAQAGKAVHVINRGNICARIEGKETKLYATGLFLNHGVGMSPDGSRLVVGGGGEGYTGALGDAKPVSFTLETVSGEYFNRFAVRDDGTAFGVTTAFRVVRISKDGKVEKVAAVY